MGYNSLTEIALDLTGGDRGAMYLQIQHQLNHELNDGVFKPVALEDCCESPRIMVNESFSYEVTLDDGRLYINTSDYASDGYEGMECMNCGREYDVQALMTTGEVETC